MAEERIGDFMVRIGAMTQEQVEDVIMRQKKDPGKLFGIIAIEEGYINDEAIHKYIAEQE